MKYRVRKFKEKTFISLTDIFKDYQDNYLEYPKKLNLSVATKNVPKEYILKAQGAKVGTYLDICFLPQFLSKRRNINTTFKNELLKELKQNDLLYSNSFESFFCDLIEDFIKEEYPNIGIVRQKTLNNKNFDVCIDNKLLIEFDEYEHRYLKQNDSSKDLIASNNNFKLLRFNSFDSYGKSLSKINKEILYIIS